MKEVTFDLVIKDAFVCMAIRGKYSLGRGSNLCKGTEAGLYQQLPICKAKGLNSSSGCGNYGKKENELLLRSFQRNLKYLQAIQLKEVECKQHTCLVFCWQNTTILGLRIKQIWAQFLSLRNILSNERNGQIKTISTDQYAPC